MTDIIFTDSPSNNRTVKPTQTIFKNDSGVKIALKYDSGSTVDVDIGASTTNLSKTIVGIVYNANNYYSSHSVDYTIPAHKIVSITYDKRNFTMSIP